MLYTQEESATIEQIVTFRVTEANARMAETPGNRLYLIRLACGDGIRKAEPLRLFSERIKRETGEQYDPSTLSLLERDEQEWKVRDALVLAAVDPKARGDRWLAFGNKPEAAPAQLTPDLGKGADDLARWTQQGAEASAPPASARAAGEHPTPARPPRKRPK